MLYSLALLISQTAIEAAPQIPTPAPAARLPANQVDPGVLPDSAETLQISKVGNWAIRIDKTLGYGCYAFAYYDDGTTLRIMASPTHNNVYIGLANPRWRSLQIEQSYLVDIQFGASEPWQGNAAVIELSPTLKMLSLPIDGEFLDELASSRLVEARYQKRPLAYLRLDRSKEMLDSLAACQEAVEDYIDDPFN